MMRGSLMLLACLCFASASGGHTGNGAKDKQGQIAAIRQTPTLQPPVKTEFPLQWVFSVLTKDQEEDKLEELELPLWRRIVAEAVILDASQVEIRSRTRRSAATGGQRRKLTNVDAVVYCQTQIQRNAVTTRIQEKGDENLEKVITQRYGSISKDITTKSVENLGPASNPSPAATPSPGDVPATPAASAPPSGAGGDVNPAVYAALAALVIPIGAAIYYLSRQNAKTQQQLQQVVANTRPLATTLPAVGNPSAPTLPNDLTNVQNLPTNPYMVQPSAPPGVQQMGATAPGWRG